MSTFISETPYTGGDKHHFQCFFGRICTLRVVEIRYSDGSAGNTEAGTTSFTQRSVHGDQPEPLVNVNNSNIFKCKQKVFLCFIILSLKGSFKNDQFKTKSLNYTTHLRAGDRQWRLIRVCVLVAALLSGRRHRGPCVCSYQSSLIQAPGLHVRLMKRKCCRWHCLRLIS